MLIDKIQVQQVIFNLVRNAVEALETSKKREITIKTLPSDNGTLEIQIKDTGPGIDPRILEQFLTPYRSTKKGGMGVGLSISQSVINAHGGRLWAMNTQGRGAIVSFTVPLVDERHGAHSIYCG